MKKKCYQNLEDRVDSNGFIKYPESAYVIQCEDVLVLIILALSGLVPSISIFNQNVLFKWKI